MIQRDQNRISFAGQIGFADILGPLAVLHKAVNAGYQDIILDFSSCTAVFAPPVLAICSQIMRLRHSGIDFEIVLPKDPELARLFRNANWAHFLSPSQNEASTFRGFTQVPATQFTNPEEQFEAVNKIVNGILGAVPNLSRAEFAALEWCINEITDNVLVHSQSAIGGLVQVSTFQRGIKRVEYIVVDAGVGIPKTLRQSSPDLSSDAAALEKAIREGVTRDKELGQGNGLFGSFQVACTSRGYFHLESGYGKLSFSARRLQVTTEKIPFEGTLVAAQINLSDPLLLAEALRFGGRLHVPADFVETKYEQHNANQVLFLIKHEAPSYGSRVAGTPIRNKLLNLIRMCPGQRIVIDFAEVPLISSSFADEVLGKLFSELGPMTFAQRFEFRNVASTVQQLVDKAIVQRLSVSGVNKTA